MRYIVTADTDVGIVKHTNQDSLCAFHATASCGEIVMVIVCDGMGGLDKGELASAEVVRAFERWFREDLQYELEFLDMRVIAGKWELMLKDLNLRIMSYGNQIHTSLGTTFTGILLIDSTYLAVHIGDSRLYHIDEQLQQLTEDHTLMAQKIKNGELTPEQAEMDRRRNVLLQCVGASPKIEPQVLFGTVHSGVYLLCSDGFRHKISGQEIQDAFQKNKLYDKNAMHQQATNMILTVKQRQERDNISVVLIRVD